MMKSNVNFSVAVIDVGSNSVRLMIKNGLEKQKYLTTTRLAEGKANNLLAQKSIDRTLNAVVAFFTKAVTLGCNKIYVFATAAVRNCKNGGELVKLIKDKTGLNVEVVSGETEAELALLGALNGEDGGVIDIGGASTEVAVKIGKETVYSVSYPVGAVTLASEFKGDYEKAKEYLSSLIKGVRQNFDLKFYGIGGTITTIGSIALDLNDYQPEVFDKKSIPFKTVSETVDELLRLTQDEIKKKYVIASKRSDIIGFGGLILISVLKAYKINEIIVSDGDNLEGYLEYKLNEKTQKR